MSLRVVLGTSLALILVFPCWTTATEAKVKPSAAAAERQAAAARAASKKETSKKEASKKEASQKAPKGRAQKEAAKKEPAQRAEKEEKEKSSKEAAQKGRNQKKKEEARKERAEKEAASRKEEAARKEEARKERAQQEAARREQAQREAALREEARKERAEKEAALAAMKQQLRELRKQVVDMERLRAELEEVRAKIRDSAPKPTIWGGVPLTLALSARAAAPAHGARPSGNPAIAALALPIPDVRDHDPLPLQPPVNPATATLPAVIREQPAAPLPKSAVEEAKAYLIATATPGYTMTRQGAEVAIGRLHPGFAVKLAETVRRAREEGMAGAGVFSAYRPPAFGIGGFRDKFDSLHSYGLAADITGIGRAGSPSAHRWHQIVLEVGLYLPYGPDHRVEFNHTQFIPPRIAPRELRETIMADGPIDLRTMWLTSGVDAHVPEPPAAVAVASGGDASATADAGEAAGAAPLLRVRTDEVTE
jgi:hypothetical protein